ncbi:MAG: HPr family phosphocarrier protein [Deltaproteobacteria bacterium]|nr:HPr family phosphocarrier protein [Deltaproteobacteria bacterium]
MNAEHGSVERVYTIKNRFGLHARAASRFVQLASKFDSDIYVEKDGQEVNGKSIMGILILAASCGSEVRVRAVGRDSPEALHSLGDLIERGFDEDD